MHLLDLMRVDTVISKLANARRAVVSYNRKYVHVDCQRYVFV